MARSSRSRTAAAARPAVRSPRIAELISPTIALPGGRLCPEAVALLEAIDREGSISGAGRALGFSYKHAWDLVALTNKLAHARVVEALAGGSRGGGTALTSTGRHLVQDYRALERTIQRAAAPRLATLARRVAR
ncbi:LysR family transcriptional regulator [Paracraurococcus sp. LOR1-02]|uniref:LysR family transcriptional regulator n=1 Tax=Paracraurococcus lichenis TaxID=3064888 RepID=A0ABT9E9F6_9PROT|nr:LysR family transcriptional regulator [Paracraurococcus sp. LOR1-02]MDO9712832.1 LysR family transcriptional regulator [Paracraurococcus sp. LOR1-02]